MRLVGNNAEQLLQLTDRRLDTTDGGKMCMQLGVRQS